MTSVYVVLLLSAIALMQLLFGGGDGTRLIYVLPSNVLLGLTGLLTLFSFSRIREKEPLDRGCVLSTAALAIYLLVRMALSPVESLALADFLVLLASLLVYFITALFVKKTGHRMAIVIVLLVIGLGHVAIGVIQFAQDSYFLPTSPTGRMDASRRASGLFISPNHLAGFLEVAFIMGTSVCLWGGFRAIARVLIAYLTLACLAGLILTGSRGGYLSTTAGVAALAMMSIWTARAALSRRTLPLIIGIVAIISVVGGIIAVASDRSFAIKARANSVFVSRDIRFQLWEAALRQFQLAPVFGTGSRTYLYYGRQLRAPEVQTDPVFAHGDYLQTLAEYGAAGLALFIIFIGLHLRHGWRRWHRMIDRLGRYRLLAADRNSLALQLGCLSALVAFLVHSVMDFNLHIPANALLIALIFGMIATRSNHPDETPARGWARLAGLLPAALGLWMIAVGAPKLPGELFVERARTKLVQGKASEALQDTEQALKWGTRNPELHYYIGEANRLLLPRANSASAQASLLGAALRGYSDGLALFPQDVRLQLMTAWTLQRMARFDEAAVHLARAAELDPNSGTVWAYHALHRKHSGNAPEAIAYYEKAYRLGCNIPEVMGVLGEQLDLPALQKAAAAAQPAPPAAPK
jgi:O-antigen ligase